MLNLNQTLFLNVSYNIQRGIFIRSFGYVFVVALFIDILRSQVSEINLLQLVPGVYLIILFFSFLFLVLSSDLFNYFCFEADLKKNFGTKTSNKVKYFILTKLKVFFFFFVFILIFNTVIPLSFDSFINFGEKNVENLWSLDEVLGLEISLCFIFFLISQFPIYVLSSLTTERDNLFLLDFWKTFSFIIFFIAGIFTPTVDGYTQLSFAFCTFILYLFLLFFIQKRSNKKSTFISLLAS